MAGVALAVLIGARVEALDEQRAGWGETMTVAVVTEHVDAGAPVVGAIEMRELPRELVPAQAVIASVEGLAKVDLYPGEVLLRERITGDRRGLAPGTAALTLQMATAMPLVADGDLVDLWSVDSANFSSRRVAHRVVVLAVTDRTITVAVPDAQVPDATVASLRPVTVTLLG